MRISRVIAMAALAVLLVPGCGSDDDLVGEIHWFGSLIQGRTYPGGRRQGLDRHVASSFVSRARYTNFNGSLLQP